MHKMPYKHIAAHLQKTELACRLHYHQLSMGTKRRRRHSSVSSTKSFQRPVASQEAYETPQPHINTISPPDSPESTFNENHKRTSSYSPVNILPKPVNAAAQRVISNNHSLHLITQEVERFEEQSRVDRLRLDRIYDAHRAEFWSRIAREYGDDIHPAVLEEAWRQSVRASGNHYPPTPPSRSPESHKASPSTLGTAFSESKATNAFRPINLQRSVASAPAVPRRSSFAISALLNEDKEVRNTAYATIGEEVAI